MRRRGSGLQCHDAGHEVEVLVGQAVFQHGEAHVVALVGGFNVRVVEELARHVGRCVLVFHGSVRARVFRFFCQSSAEI